MNFKDLTNFNPSLKITNFVKNINGGVKYYNGQVTTTGLEEGIGR